MKKHLSLLMSVLALGTAQQASAQLLGLGAAAAGVIVNRKAAKNANRAQQEATSSQPEAATPVRLVELDLTPYGAPLLLQVPEGTTGKRSEYDNIWINGPEFALTINSSDNDIFNAAQSMADHKSMTMMEGGGYTVVTDKPLVFRAHNSNADIDDNFAVIVNDAKANKHYIIVKGVREDNGIDPFGSAQTEAMFQAAQSAHLTAAALAAAPKPPKAAPVLKTAVRSATGETDLSAFGLPVLVKVPVGTKVEQTETGRVTLNGPDFSMRVMTESKSLAEIQASIAKAKKEFQKMGMLVTADEPLAFALKDRKSGETLWSVTLPDATHGKIYTLEQNFGGPKLSPGRDATLFAVAKAAHLKK